MKTKTHPGIVKRVYRELGLTGVVTHHEPTENNRVGQSGVHTFVDDIITIVLESENEAMAYKNLHIYLIEGQI